MHIVNCAKTIIPCALALLLIHAACAIAAVNPTAHDLLQQATDATAKIDDADKQSQMLMRICWAQARSGDCPGAIATAATIAAPAQKNAAYGPIAGAMARAGDMAGVNSLLDQVADPVAKMALYENVVEAQAERGDIAAAKASALNITVPFLHAHATEHIALAQAKAGDADGALALIASINGADDVQVEAYVRVAEMQTEAGQKAQGRQTMALASDALKRMSNLPSFMTAVATGNIVEGLVIQGDLSTAMELANGATDPSAKNMLLYSIARAQIRVGDLSGAEKTAALSDPNYQFNVDVSIAAAMVKAANPARAKQMLKTATDLAATLTDPYQRSTAMERMGAAQVQVNGAAVAATWAASQEDPDLRIQALIGIVEGLPNYHGPPVL